MTFRGRAREGATDGKYKQLGQAWALAAHRWNLPAVDCTQDLAIVLARKQGMPGQRFPQHRSHREHVGMRARLRATNQFRGEVAQLALDESRHGQHARAIARTGQAEVGQLDHAAYAKQEILW